VEIFGEEGPEGIRVRRACFCPETGARKEDQTYAIAFLDLVEARHLAEKQLVVITEGLAALDDFVKRLGKADLVGDGVQKLKQKDIEALLAALTKKLPEMVPGLP
jgi:hypothetical protein